MAVVRKKDFAALCNVGPSTVTGWLRTGQLTAPAVVGEGRFARIDVELGKAMLNHVLDIDKRLANGLHTRLGELDDPETIEQKIKQQRSRQLELKIEEAESKKAEREGRLVDAAEARARLTRAVADVKVFFDSTMLDLADQVAVLAAQPAPLTKRSILLALTAGYRAAFVRRYGEPLIHPGYLVDRFHETDLL